MAPGPRVRAGEPADPLRAFNSANDRLRRLTPEPNGNSRLGPGLPVRAHATGSARIPSELVTLSCRLGRLTTRLGLTLSEGESESGGPCATRSELARQSRPRPSDDSSLSLAAERLRTASQRFRDSESPRLGSWCNQGGQYPTHTRCQYPVRHKSVRAIRVSTPGRSGWYPTYSRRPIWGGLLPSVLSESVPQGARAVSAPR